MLHAIRRKLSRALTNLRLALQRPRALLLPRARRDAAGSSGRWLAQRFRDSRDLSFGARARRTELNYSIYLPAGCSSRDSLPLLVMLHGCRQDAALFAAGTRMNQLADRERFVVLYPEQLREANAFSCWNWFDSTAVDGAGEAGMIAQLTRTAIDRYPVDARRVYLAGMSAGGAMACTLAIHHGKLFAAAAVHSGLMHAAAVSVLQATQAMHSGSRASPSDTVRQALQIAGGQASFVPTLVIHGDGDKVVHPVNADMIIEQLECLARGTEESALVAASPETRHEGGRNYLQQDYHCRGRAALRRIVVKGLGHAWSGGDPQHPFNDAAGPSASQLVWDFVSQHRRSLPIDSPAAAVG
jgi:poly(hydroxyalkanoate) depolymerase family esterase